MKVLMSVIAIAVVGFAITPQEYIKAIHMDYQVKEEVIELNWGQRCKQETAVFADGSEYKIGGCKILERSPVSYG
jgi:hypothetical protein